MSPVSRARKKKGAGKNSRQARRTVGRPEPVRDGSFDRPADEAEPGWWADADMASRYLDGIDPSSDPDAVITRRRFAVPTLTARVHGADVELDPADEDERELLILAEHPEYRAHAILHALAHELSEELHPALTGRRAAGPDVTAYRERLRKL